MKRLFIYVVSLFVVSLFLFTPKQANALIVIDELSDEFTSGVWTVLGNNRGGGIGTAYKILKFKPQGSDILGTETDGGPKDNPSQNRSLADIQNEIRDDFKIISTTAFAFGLDVNQNANETACTASTDDECVYVTSLIITINDGVSVNNTYVLGDIVHAYELAQGSSSADVLFQINLGYDLMALNPSTDPNSFIITATHNYANAGPEEYFMDGAFFPDDQIEVIPEPATVLLFTTGLAGAFIRRRRRS